MYDLLMYLSVAAMFSLLTIPLLSRKGKRHFVLSLVMALLWPVSIIMAVAVGLAYLVSLVMDVFEGE